MATRNRKKKPASPRPQPITFVDIFAGIGGFHQALMLAGATLVWACEFDADAAETYRRNFGYDPTGDMTTVRAEAVPHHDILCAGFPCQSFSVEGKRLGMNDQRGRLFWHLVRILTAKQPSAFMLENVDSLRHANNRWSHDRIVAALQKVGYIVYEAVLNAREFSLPQSRRKPFMVGFHRSLVQHGRETYAVQKDNENPGSFDVDQVLVSCR